jgi:hypothetical protein
VGAVVSRVEKDGVAGDAEVVERFQQFADMPVVLDHAVGIFGAGGETRLIAMLWPYMGAQMHARRVEPTEEWLVRRHLPLDEVDGGVRGLVVDRLHALSRQWTGVLDGLLADPSPTWLLGGVVGIRSLAAQDAARSELLPEFRVSWVVEELGLFFCVEMIQVAEEFVEAVHRGQITVQIAEMILPELSRGVAERLERLGDGNVAVLQADRRAWGRRLWRGRYAECIAR